LLLEESVEPVNLSLHLATLSFHLSDEFINSGMVSGVDSVEVRNVSLLVTAHLFSKSQNVGIVFSLEISHSLVLLSKTFGGSIFLFLLLNGMH
jgi:hypothetical protein